MSQPASMKVRLITYQGTRVVHPEHATEITDQNEVLSAIFAMRREVYRLFGSDAVPTRLYEHNNEASVDEGMPFRFLAVETNPHREDNKVVYCEVPLKILKHFNIPLSKPGENETSSRTKSAVGSIGKKAREKIIEFFKDNPRPRQKLLDEVQKGIGSKSSQYTRRRLAELVRAGELHFQKGKGLWELPS
jgi:hypothetical protein